MKTQVCLMAISLLAGIGFFGGVPRCFATPFVDIRGNWDSAVESTVPAGIATGCLGACGIEASLDTTVTGSRTLSASASGGFEITNTSDDYIDETLVFLLAWSAFNPGGPEVGISIDNPLTQAASFESTVVFDGMVQDFHSGSVGILGDDCFSPTTCGVKSPDTSSEEFVVNIATLAPGESEEFVADVNITAMFAVVPASSSLANLVAGLSLFLLSTICYRRRSSRLPTFIRPCGRSRQQ